jgi:hypothetical protein
MRVAVGKKVRVGPGDSVVIRGRLTADAKLGRLFVFAKEGDAEFSPYVENIGDMLAVSGDRPQMYTPMSMRLDSFKPEREISFIVDIDGWIRVMQEVDRPNDTKAIIKIERTMNPNLPWVQRLSRKLSEMIPWNS